MRTFSTAKLFHTKAFRKTVLLLVFLFPLAMFAQKNRMVVGNNQFAFEFYHNATASGKNVCISPLSLYTVLGMVYEGARDSTAQQMDSLLYFGDDKPKLHNAFSFVLSELAP